jgi:hypothetical protein
MEPIILNKIVTKIEKVEKEGWGSVTIEIQSGKIVYIKYNVGEAIVIRKNIEEAKLHLS